ncbi:agmatinase [Pantoea coffeiphila]|uniref:Agmatinase n=1 Tax=Pantoea coffeiphila TaxID=1465635 RepID=A0A2S9I7B3_9GAMM|nr:agmatinase [Pantoea coffeiphila]PRD13614.1 agmatinase [Pantoea coffeiphila]
MSDKNSKYLAFSGIPTFWRTPQSRDINGVDIVVMGVPFDCGVSNRSGARLGALAIRQMSLHTGNFCHPWDFDIKDRLNIVDYGDVGMSVGGNTTNYMIEDTYQHALNIFSRGARLFTLGGDHTIPYGLVRAAKERFGKIALVHFDSHQDSLDGENGNAIFHGTFTHDLAAEGTVDAAHSTQVFIRTDMPNEHGYNILYAKDTFYMEPSEVARKIRENAGDLPVYITFDVDGIDPAYTPGTGTPVPGGPSTAYVREVLRHLEGLNVIGGDIVEVAPQYDAGEITSLAAGVIAGDIIQLMGRSILSSR